MERKDRHTSAVEPITDDSIRAAARDFAVTRTAFLAAHAADYKSLETAGTYELAENARELLMELIDSRAVDEPDWVLRVFGATPASAP